MELPLTAPPLIPRRVLWGNPDRSSPMLSPDGRWLAFLTDHERVKNIWIAPSGEPAAAKPLTRDRQRGIHAYRWSFNGELLYVQDRDGDENEHCFIVDPSSGAVRDLTPVAGVKASLIEASPDDPGRIAVALNDRDPRFHDVHVIDLGSGERTLAYRNDRYASVLTHALRPLVGIGTDARGGGYIDALTAPEPRRLLDIPPEDAWTTGPIGCDASGATLYISDSHGRDNAALVAVSLATGACEELAADAGADISEWFLHPRSRRVRAVASTRERRRWQVLDRDIAEDFRVLAAVVDGDFQIVSCTLDDRAWIFAYVVDDGPTRYYRYERGQRKATFLFSHQAALEHARLAKMRPVLITARDGLGLFSYLSLPPEAGIGAGPRPAAPLPMVLLVHGGPWWRDDWGFSPWTQWLANRGYAVLSVNFRASTGFGKAFLNAGDGEWGGKMHDDLIDAVDWAIAEGIADPARVAIFGGSYGGYAVLAGLTFTPERFAAGVDIVGPSSLLTLVANAPPYWHTFLPVFRRRLGDWDTAEGRRLLRERSPLHHVERIRRPLLIGQGANDPRVTQAESDQIVAAMSAKGIPVTYALYPDEGHGFARPENNLSFYAIAEAFLAEHLGGRAEPVGDDLAGSSVRILAGAERIPGLDAARRRPP